MNVVNENSNNLSVIETATNTVVATVPVGLFAPRAMAITPDGARVYVVANITDLSLRRIHSSKPYSTEGVWQKPK